jgi:phosphoribosylformimino-5-aminoimidazole carboxamide ribotide isomerase
VIIIPAIDLKDGKCVRLAQGDFNRITVYSDDPVEMALKWQEKGAKRLHVVDLDGSREGSPRNMPVIKDMIKALRIPIELGGGIRTMEILNSYMSTGIRWAILGTAALRDESFARNACIAHPDGIILGIDAAAGNVAVQGWTEKTETTALELAKRYEKQKVSSIVYTDIKRDGMERGVNIEATRAFAESIEIPVIASGGVSGIDDIKNVLTIETSGVMGIIAGKSLYTGALALEEAIALTDGK